MALSKEIITAVQAAYAEAVRVINAKDPNRYYSNQSNFNRLRDALLANGISYEQMALPALWGSVFLELDATGALMSAPIAEPTTEEIERIEARRKREFENQFGTSTRREINESPVHANRRIASELAAKVLPKIEETRKSFMQGLERRAQQIEPSVSDHLSRLDSAIVGGRKAVAQWLRTTPTAISVQLRRQYPTLSVKMDRVLQGLPADPSSEEHL